MTDTILTVICPFASALLVSIAEILLARSKAFGRSHVRDLKLPKPIWQIKWKDKTGETALSFLIIWTAALLQFLFSMVCLFIVLRTANLPAEKTGSPVSPLFFAAGSLISDLCILYLLRSRKRKGCRAAVLIAVLSYVLIAVELFLFNFNSFKANPHKVTIKGADLKPEFAYDADSEEGVLQFEEDGVLIKSDCALFIPDVPDDAYTLTVNFVPAGSSKTGRFKLRLLLEDKNSMYEYRVSDVRKISGLQSTTLFFRPYGHIDSLMIAFEGLDHNVKIDTVTVCDCNIYGAVFTRYLALLFVTVLIVLTVCLKLYDIDYDSSKTVHSALLTLVFILTTGITYGLYFRKDMKLDKYPFEDNSQVADIYQLAFDSAMKRIPYLDVSSNETLLDLDNPYDAGERDSKGTLYRWDYAYKDGKYYCYFGKAPVYTVYYPIYLITHRVPNYSSAVAIFGTLSAVAVILAFLAAVRLFVPRKNLLALLFMIPAVAATSFLYINMVWSEKYYVACGSALSAIGFAMFFGFTAVKTKKAVKRFVLFFLSGISLAVCAGSRPTVAICAAAMLPVFFGVLFDKKRKLGIRLSEAAVFLVPVITGIMLILLNNLAMFGSITDFGENYQLTVSDVSSLKVTPEMMPSAIYYNFLMPFTPMETFPFFEARGIILNSYEIYRNIEPSVGLLNIPFLLLGMVFLPGAFVRAKGRVSKKEAVIFNSFIAACLITVLFISWFDFSRGGVCIRYMSDFSWLLAILSGVILLRRIMRKSGRKTVYGIVLAASFLTVLIVFFMVISLDLCNFAKMYPQFLENCEDFFLFWH